MSFTLRPQVQPRTCMDGHANKLLWGCNGSAVQKWTARDSNNNGTFALVCQRGGTCLGSRLGSDVYLAECNGRFSESWTTTQALVATG